MHREINNSSRVGGIMKKNSLMSKVVTNTERNYYANRIILLCKEKQYRLETYFLAVNIFDKYLSLENSQTTLSEQNKQV